jgi:hypothetical protein
MEKKKLGQIIGKVETDLPVISNIDDMVKELLEREQFKRISKLLDKGISDKVIIEVYDLTVKN